MKYKRWIKFDVFKVVIYYRVFMNKHTSHTDEIRNKHVTFLQRVIPEETKCRVIERSIYNYAIHEAIQKNYKKKWTDPYFKQLYDGKFRSVYTNLREGSYLHNPTFRSRVVSGEIDCTQIATLSGHDIFPENWKDLLDKKAAGDKMRYEFKPEAMTDTFKCDRCSSRSCSYYEVQTRSADEPMTTFINCLECGNRWKQ
jgi:transcription elongation factor S-II